MAQDYDKIIKENFRNAIVAFMGQVIEEDIIAIRNLDPKMQKTIEREPDFFKVVHRRNEDRRFVLHVEWQLKGPWIKVRNRMMFYKVLGIELTDLPIKQYVLYLGKGTPKAPTTFKDEDMDYRYHLIRIKSISYKKILNAPDVGVALFAILANFEDKSPKQVIEKIGERIMKESQGELEAEKWQRQLEIISNIHNLQDLTIKTLESMPFVYNLKTDLRYLQGREEGEEEGLEKGLEKGMDNHSIITIINMILRTNFNKVQIAELASVKINFVEKWEKIVKNLKLKTIWTDFGEVKNNKKKGKE